jgi:hypothetical protein
VVLVCAGLGVLSAGAVKAETSGPGTGANTAPVACIAEGGRTLDAGLASLGGEADGGVWEARVTLDGSCSFDADSAPGLRMTVFYRAF